MKVAWQFIAKKGRERGSVPLGYGVILYRESINKLKDAVDRPNHTVPPGQELWKSLST
jgi:hypothetical protein